MSNIHLRYPLSLITDETDYLSIRVVKYSPSKLSVPDRNSPFALNTASSLALGQIGLEKILGTIKLPMPINVSDSNSVDWDGTKIDPIALKAFDVAQRAVQNAQLQEGDTITSMVTRTLDGLAKDATSTYRALDENVRNAIKDRLIVGAVNVFNANLDPATVLSRETGQVLNPNLELTFKGVSLRQFDFTFKLTPRSQEEGLQVKAIINTFKRRMAAKTTSSSTSSAGIFISAPDIFVMEFKKGREKHPFLYSMKPCALKNMGVNYADGAPYSTYYDGTPVSLELKLSFKELNPIYAEDYGIFDQGVGF